MTGKAIHTPKQSRSLKSVSAILEATVRLLETRGYENITTNAIAEEAGTNISTLYRYFANKEAILEQLLERYNEERVAIVQGVMAQGGSQSQSVTMVLEKLVAQIRNEPWLGSFMRALASAPELEALSQHADQHLIDTFIAAIADNTQMRRSGFIKKQAAMQLLVHTYNNGTLLIVNAPPKLRKAMLTEVSLLVSSYLENYTASTDL